MKQDEELLIEVPEHNDEFPPDDAIAEIADVAPDLTEQERKYVYWRSIAVPPAAAHAKAGYSGTNWRAVETRPRIRTALQDLNERVSPQYRVTQQTVIGLLMEGIEIARMKDQAKTMIEGAVALANITGVAAATKYQVDQRTLLEVNRPNEGPKALRHLPRNNLEALVGVQRTLPSHVIEAEFEVVSAELPAQ